jgi:hypothetical protein
VVAVDWTDGGSGVEASGGVNQQCPELGGESCRRRQLRTREGRMCLKLVSD